MVKKQKTIEIFWINTAQFTVLLCTKIVAYNKNNKQPSVVYNYIYVYTVSFTWQGYAYDITKIIVMPHFTCDLILSLEIKSAYTSSADSEIFFFRYSVVRTCKKNKESSIYHQFSDFKILKVHSYCKIAFALHHDCERVKST